jgi:hypothetical protein
MCPEIDSPTSYEIRIVIHFLHAKNTSVGDIRHELRAIYGLNIMSDRTERQ